MDLDSAQMWTAPPQTQNATKAYHVSLFGPKMAVSLRVTTFRAPSPTFATNWKAYEQRRTMKQRQEKIQRGG